MAIQRNENIVRWILGAIATSLLILPLGNAPLEAAPDDSVIPAAGRAFEAGNHKDAISLITTLIEQRPDDPGPVRVRASFYDRLRQFSKALTDYNQVVRLDPENADAWHQRGSVRFKTGDVAGSIADFDQAIKRNPNLEPRHWQRGLSYYYHGQYPAGARQFELYQTYDAADVENVVWRFICQSRYDGVDKARKDMMPLGGTDRRVPMMEIDALFRDKGTVDQVFDKAQAGSPNETQRKYRMFYGHLYVGLFYDATGQPEKSREHIFAAERLKNDHYMWDVAHVHASRLRAETPAAKNRPVATPTERDETAEKE